MRIDKITPAQTARFSDWTQKWIDIGLSTAPADFDRATEAALRAYKLCNLNRPMVILRMGSPYGATVGGALAWALLKEFGTQVRSQVGSQVRSQVESQVESQVGPQVGSQVRSQVRSQVWSQVWSQVESQVGSQVESQVGSQVESQVWSQVGSQVRSQVRSQVWSQVWSQVESQVGSQVESQVGSQVRSQVWSQVGSQVGSQVESQVRSGLNNDRGGTFWSSWCAYVSFMRDVLGWVDPVLTERFEIDEALAQSVGWCWWHENVLALSDRPQTINRDERGRLHCVDGPSIAYRDGWSLWHVHGVAVPEDIITERRTITAKRIEEESNAEVRRVMIDFYGAARYVQDSGAQVIQTLPADHALIGLRTARLLRKEVPNDEPIVYVDLLNSTPEPDGSVKRYMLRVDPAAYDGLASRDVLAAAASTWRNADGSLHFKRPQDYRPIAES